MPIIPGQGFVDLRLLTFTINRSITLHFFVHHEPQNAFPHQSEENMQCYFILREIDQVLRLTSEDDWMFNTERRSEQSIRTVVNQICKNDHIWASPAELKALKLLGALSTRAQKTALISPQTLIKILRHFQSDINALIFESILITFLSEQRLLRSTLLGLSHAVYQYNIRNGLDHDDKTSFELIKNLTTLNGTSNTPYPPPWQRYFSPDAPVLDLKLSLLLDAALRHPQSSSTISTFNTLVHPVNHAGQLSHDLTSNMTTEGFGDEDLDEGKKKSGKKSKGRAAGRKSQSMVDDDDNTTNDFDHPNDNNDNNHNQLVNATSTPLTSMDSSQPHIDDDLIQQLNKLSLQTLVETSDNGNTKLTLNYPGSSDCESQNHTNLQQLNNRLSSLLTAPSTTSTFELTFQRTPQQPMNPHPHPLSPHPHQPPLHNQPNRMTENSSASAQPKPTFNPFALPTPPHPSLSATQTPTTSTPLQPSSPPQSHLSTCPIDTFIESAGKAGKGKLTPSTPQSWDETSLNHSLTPISPTTPSTDLTQFSQPLPAVPWNVYTLIPQSHQHTSVPHQPTSYPTTNQPTGQNQRHSIHNQTPHQSHPHSSTPSQTRLQPPLLQQVYPYLQFTHQPFSLPYLSVTLFHPTIYNQFSCPFWFLRGYPQFLLKHQSTRLAKLNKDDLLATFAPNSPDAPSQALLPPIPDDNDCVNGDCSILQPKKRRSKTPQPVILNFCPNPLQGSELTGEHVYPITLSSCALHHGVSPNLLSLDDGQEAKLNRIAMRRKQHESSMTPDELQSHNALKEFGFNLDVLYQSDDDNDDDDDRDDDDRDGDDGNHHISGQMSSSIDMNDKTTPNHEDEPIPDCAAILAAPLIPLSNIQSSTPFQNTLFQPQRASLTISSTKSILPSAATTTITSSTISHQLPTTSSSTPNAYPIYTLNERIQQSLLKTLFLPPTPVFTFSHLLRYAPEFIKPLPTSTPCLECVLQEYDYSQKFPPCTRTISYIAKHYSPSFQNPCFCQQRKENMTLNDHNASGTHQTTLPENKAKTYPHELFSLRSTEHPPELQLGADPDLFSIPSIVSFSTLLALSVIYYQSRQSPPSPPSPPTSSQPADLSQDQPCQVEETEETRILIDAFRWLTTRLQFPVAYSTAIVEFDPTMSKIIFQAQSDATPPPLFLVPDISPEAFSRTPSESTRGKGKHGKTQRDTIMADAAYGHAGFNDIDDEIGKMNDEEFNTNNQSPRPPTTSSSLVDTLVTQLQSDLSLTVIDYINVKFHSSQHSPFSPTASSSASSSSSTSSTPIPSLLPQPLTQASFPYQITPATIPLFRSFLYHLNQMPPTLKMRLLRHAGLLFPLSAQDTLVWPNGSSTPGNLTNFECFCIDSATNQEELDDCGVPLDQIDKVPSSDPPEKKKKLTPAQIKAQKRLQTQQRTAAKKLEQQQRELQFQQQQLEQCQKDSTTSFDYTDHNHSNVNNNENNQDSEIEHVVKRRKQITRQSVSQHHANQGGKHHDQEVSLAAAASSSSNHNERSVQPNSTLSLPQDQSAPALYDPFSPIQQPRDQNQHNNYQSPSPPPDGYQLEGIFGQQHPSAQDFHQQYYYNHYSQTDQQHIKAPGEYDPSWPYQFEHQGFSYNRYSLQTHTSPFPTAESTTVVIDTTDPLMSNNSFNSFSDSSFLHHLPPFSIADPLTPPPPPPTEPAHLFVNPNFDDSPPTPTPINNISDHLTFNPLLYLIDGDNGVDSTSQQHRSTTSFHLPGSPVFGAMFSSEDPAQSYPQSPNPIFSDQQPNHHPPQPPLLPTSPLFFQSSLDFVNQYNGGVSTHSESLPPRFPPSSPTNPQFPHDMGE